LSFDDEEKEKEGWRKVRILLVAARETAERKEKDARNGKSRGSGRRHPTVELSGSSQHLQKGGKVNVDRRSGSGTFSTSFEVRDGVDDGETAVAEALEQCERDAFEDGFGGLNADDPVDGSRGIRPDAKSDEGDEDGGE
jgi:hypothetical protein